MNLAFFFLFFSFFLSVFGFGFSAEASRRRLKLCRTVNGIKRGAPDSRRRFFRGGVTGAFEEEAGEDFIKIFGSRLSAS